MIMRNVQQNWQNSLMSSFINKGHNFWKVIKQGSRLAISQAFQSEDGNNEEWMDFELHHAFLFRRVSVSQRPFNKSYASNLNFVDI